MPNNLPQRKKHRLPRDCYLGGDAFFLTICTAGKTALLTEEPVRSAVKTELDTEKAGIGGHVHAYVVMPDHLHVVISGAKDVATWVRRFKSRATYYARKNGYSGEVWQRGYYDEGLRNPEKTGEVLRYMAMNPVAAGLVATPEEWLFKFGCR